MPTIQDFRSGSIIYFQGDKGASIYTLKSGQICAEFREGSKETQTILSIGEFFGVKSSLTGSPREETIKAIKDSSIIIFSLAEFKNYILQKSDILLQMLRVFSHELRDVHYNLRSILKEGKTENPAFELAKTGEALHQGKNFEHAVYAYKQYLSTYPDGANSKRILSLLALAVKEKQYPRSPETLTQESQSYMTKKQIQRQDGILQKKIEGEVKSVKETSIRSLFMEAKKFRKQENTERAIYYFKLCIQKDNIAVSDETIRERAFYELTLLLTETKEWNDGKKYLIQYIQSYPKSQYLRSALSSLAFTEEQLGNIQIAKQLYNKVVDALPKDKVTKAASEELKRLSKIKT